MSLEPLHRSARCAGFALLLSVSPSVLAQPSALSAANPEVEALCAAVDPRVIDWRRDIHRYPELSNREVRTAAKVADHLRGLGIEVTTGVAHTGVVGLLRGGRPVPVVALRADMDALPVTERVDLPFASRETATYGGQTVGVMHACGHDAHVAILMGVAEVLAGVRDELPGTVKLIFQPAEEGAPEGEEGGAEMMVAEGVLADPAVDAIFGLHVGADLDVGTIWTRPGGLMASADDFRIVVHGKQTHGSRPWSGIDPIVTSAMIVTGLQTIVSRQMPLTESAAVVTVGSIQGGVRSNIIPERVEMVGTVRAFDEEVRATIHDRVRRMATTIAESMGARAVVTIPLTTAYPVTTNDPELLARMMPSLEAVAGPGNVRTSNPITGAEDFSFFARQVPGLFFFLGVKPPDVAAEDAAPHHTPDFFVDESGLPLGVRALVRLTLDYLESGAATR
ncbi:MAG TPA: amidohydrolase [Thermoanaerobaculia bacterium]|nr:amidohydrolase [Thermoanaerobaculia bacterium]